MTEEGGTTKWIGVNTESLTESATITTTKDGHAVVTEVPAPGASVSVDASGAKLTLLLPPKVVDEFTKVIEAACGAAAKFTKRQSGSCALSVLDSMPSAADLNMPLDSLQAVDRWIANGAFRANLLKIHGISEAAWAALIQGAGSVTMQRYYAVVLASTTAWMLKGKLDNLTEHDLSKGLVPTTTRIQTASSTVSTTSSGCPSETPRCRNQEDCKGDQKKEKCTKVCPCISSALDDYTNTIASRKIDIRIAHASLTL